MQKNSFLKSAGSCWGLPAIILVAIVSLSSCQPKATEPASTPEDPKADEQQVAQSIEEKKQQPSISAPGADSLAQPPGFPLSDRNRKRLVRVVENWHFPYNEKVGLLLIPKPKPNFKTNWVSDPMHAIRWSVEYAVICMDTGEEPYRQRALRILDLILPTQDTDPQSKSYGLWPDFWEITIPEMQKVDGNTADFIGINLIQIRFLHEEHLPEDLKRRMDEAILHAARSVKRRDVTPSYTNPAMMSLIVTLVAGKAYQNEELWEYGKQKLKKILDYTQEQGSFTEYNSPNYNIVALNALRQVKNYITDPEVVEQIDELYNLAWKHVAVRYHPPSKQWSGPHSRNYQELLKPAQKQLLAAAVVGKPASPPRGQESRGAFLHRRVHDVPENLKHYFQSLDEPREVIETFDRLDEGEGADIIGTTWLTPDFTLGTVNRGDMWNQRRNLQAYWGTTKKPAYLRTRFLKDKDDFASVNFFSEQEKNRVLAGLNFSTNGGDRHLFLDAIKKGKFKAKRLVLRFEFGGAAKQAQVTLPSKPMDPVYISAGEMNFVIMAPVALLGGKPGHWEIEQTKRNTNLDLVLYEGETKDFFLTKMPDSVIGFGLAMAKDKDELTKLPPVTAEQQGNKLALGWDNLGLTLGTVPGAKKAVQARVTFAD